MCLFYHYLILIPKMAFKTLQLANALGLRLLEIKSVELWLHFHGIAINS